MHKWIICSLLFLATTLNYLDRQTMAILAPAIQKELHLDNAALGLLFAVFYWSYTFSLFAVGPLLDRWNLRWVYGLAVVAWSAAASLSGLAAGFASLAAARLLLGVMESANWPAASRIVARMFEPKDRGLGNGFFTSGTSIGALIAPLLILGISEAVGWRWAFVAVGSLGLLWFVFWIALTGGRKMETVWRDPDASAHAMRPARQVYRDILRRPQFWRVFAISTLINPCLYFNLNWLPVYFTQEHGLSSGQLRWILTWIYLALDLGYLASGAAILLLVRLGQPLHRARAVVCVGATVCLGMCGAAPLMPSLDSTVAALIVANFGVGVWITMYLTFTQEVAPASVSTSMGLLGGAGSLTGALAMAAVGGITQRTSSFVVPMAGVTVLAILAAVAGMAASRRAMRPAAA